MSFKEIAPFGTYFSTSKEIIRERITEPHSKGQLSFLYIGMEIRPTYPVHPGNDQWKAMRDGEPFLYYPQWLRSCV